MAATRWSVPRTWEGRTVAIFASGPSLTREQVAEVRATGIPTIAISNNGIDTDRGPAMAPWADMLYAADSGWWDHYKESALKFPGVKITCHDSTLYRDVMLLRQTGVEGFEPEPDKIRTGGNSGYQAIHVAIHAGAKRILLLGYDMGLTKGNHWFGKHPGPLRNTTQGSYDLWITRFHALNGHGSEIINCTMDSALTCFPKMELTEALHGLTTDS